MTWATLDAVVVLPSLMAELVMTMVLIGLELEKRMFVLMDW